MVQLGDLEVLTNAQWLVNLAQTPGIYFTSSSGIEVTANRGNYVDPIAAIMRATKSASLQFSDITLTKSFDQLTDWDLISTFDNFLKNGEYLSGSMSPVIRNSGLKLLGNRRIDFENCMVKSFSAPGDINVGDGASASILSLVLTVEYARFETNKTTDV